MDEKTSLKKLKKVGFKGQKIIWVHCASLGEFEQGRPVIEKLKESYPNHKILITFFSPSGYEVRKNYPGADYVFYLPLDTAKNARKFLNIVYPQMAIFVKYEFWYNYINELHKQKIPLFHISVIFRESQPFFRLWGKWFRNQLMKITWIFVQNKKSLNLLDHINISHADISGDTRFDRVVSLPNEQFESGLFSCFKSNSTLLIGGSSWKPEENMMLSLLQKNTDNLKIILAPHLVDKDHISEIKKSYSEFNPVLFSEIQNTDAKNIPSEISNKLVKSKILIIDTIGLLSHIFRFGDFAFIGGGFGVGIHNVLEAATYSIPVIFGPNYHKFNEAIGLRDLNSGFPINNESDFINISHKLINNEDYRKKCGKIAGNFVKENAGATSIILNKAKEFIVAG